MPSRSPKHAAQLVDGSSERPHLASLYQGVPTESGSLDLCFLCVRTDAIGDSLIVIMKFEALPCMTKVAKQLTLLGK